MDDPGSPTPMRGHAQPARDSVLASPRVAVLQHPLASNLVTQLRDVNTPAAQFESAIHELTRQLLWQATTHEPLDSVECQSFSGQIVKGTQFARRLAALVILRAGLSMVPPLRLLIPNTPIYQVGVKRDEITLEPRLYYSNLPTMLSGVEHLLLLDPMLATGGSARMALDLIRRVFDGEVSFLGLIGAPLGVVRLLDSDDKCRIWLAALDDRLNDQGYIVPGLGDAGDRLFGTN